MNRFERYVDTLPDGTKNLYKAELESWNVENLEHAIKLAEKLDSAGSTDSEGWVFSEIAEGIAQSARFSLLQAIWSRAINSSLEGDFGLSETPAKDLLIKFDAHFSVSEKQLFFKEIAKTLGFHITNTIDEHSSDYDLPGWMLVELDQDGKPTGRNIGGLHESFLGFEEELQ